MRVIYYYYKHYFTLCNFFAPALSDGLSLVSVGQQVSSGPQDSPRYSLRSQQCCSLDGLDSFSDSQLFHSSFQAFGTVQSAPITISITVNLMFL